MSEPYRSAYQAEIDIGVAVPINQEQVVVISQSEGGESVWHRRSLYEMLMVMIIWNLESGIWNLESGYPEPSYSKIRFMMPICQEIRDDP